MIRFLFSPQVLAVAAALCWLLTLLIMIAYFRTPRGALAIGRALEAMGGVSS